MALPKEPRQKMINMMYLVLTALLALNVSAEILNAFKTVNKSIQNSNEVIAEKNAVTYKAFQANLADPGTKEKAMIWAPKAAEAKKLSDDIYKQIEDLKSQLIEGSGKITENGEETFNGANLDAATRLMDEEGNGPKLFTALKTYKEQLLNILKPEDFAGDPNLQKTIAKDKSDFTKELPLNLAVPVSQNGSSQSADSVKNWTVNYFHMTPTIAALTILSKFQNDVKSSESQMVDYFHKKIGEVVVHFDKTGVIAGANSTYLMPGDKLSVYAGVGAFNSQASPVITINGKSVAVDAEGKATSDIIVGGSGKQTVRVNVTYRDESGKSITTPKDIEYTVGTPSGVAVSADKMNVLYIMGSVPNPLTISGGAGSEKIQASLTGGELRHVQGSAFEAFPKTPGEQKINVTIDNKTVSKIFRVKYLPDPAAFVGSKKGGAIPSAEFKAIGGLITKLENTEFEVGFKIVSYKIAAVGGNIPQYREYTVEGNRWGSAANAEALIKQAGPGTSVFFDQIKVIGPDGRQREIQPTFFSLK